MLDTVLSTFKRTRLFTETHPSPLRRSQKLQLLVDTLHEQMLNIERRWMLNNIVDTDVELLIAFSCGYIVLRKQDKNKNQWNQTILAPFILAEGFLNDCLCSTLLWINTTVELQKCRMADG